MLVPRWYGLDMFHCIYKFAYQSWDHGANKSRKPDISDFTSRFSFQGHHSGNCSEGGLEIWCLMPLSIFQLYRGGQFYWWRKQSTQRKPPLYHIMYRVHLTWTGFELATLVVIGTDWTGSLKSNYHMITTAHLGTVANVII